MCCGPNCRGEGEKQTGRKREINKYINIEREREKGEKKRWRKERAAMSVFINQS
jgi:hypothetical protein